MHRLIQHRRRVQFRAAGDHPLQNPNPLADPLPAAARRHALGVLRNSDVLPRRPVESLRVVDLDRLHHRHPENRLPHRFHGTPVLQYRQTRARKFHVLRKVREFGRTSAGIFEIR
ncbi:hypothetical protein MIMGU_mgv1a016630mg [Erythranthe guttata]|uniref:Uncharacterized protein n=1 Tax=Erythranthe guttata TaxID=4155 RepID=A0A022RV68_ERYGU|nr:hypothetical protein MIMGU_mgv1a016630mg [Erythranthe guttata]